MQAEQETNEVTPNEDRTVVLSDEDTALFDQESWNWLFGSLSEEAEEASKRLHEYAVQRELRRIFSECLTQAHRGLYGANVRCKTDLAKDVRKLLSTKSVSVSTTSALSVPVDCSALAITWNRLPKEAPPSD